MTMAQTKKWKRTPFLRALLLIAATFQVVTLPKLLLKLSLHSNFTDPQSQWWFPISTTTTNRRRAPLPPPKVYNNTPKVPPLLSSGPHPFHHEPRTNNSHYNTIPPTLSQFHNVCLTQHYHSPYLRGLLYLVPPNHTSVANNNPGRCIPCSAPLNHRGGWNGIHKNEAQVGHKCGFVGIHTMFATNISDWSECIHREESQRQLKAWAQFQIPSRVEVVKFYEGVRVINLAFDKNIGHDMWDHLLTYLPHWYEFRFGGGGGDFPMDGVISHNLRDCMGGRNDAHVLDVTGKNHKDHDVGNPYWYCQILRAINAFGGAEELSLPDATDPLINSTLHCFENLLTLHLSWGRNHGYSVESMPNKTVFDAFREILFDKFDLPRHFRNSIRSSGGKSGEMQDALGEKYLTKSWSGNSNADSSNNQPQRKILFYAHEPSARRVWTNMNSLLATYQSSTKHNQNIIFQNIHDFGNYTVREQAILFNEADAMIMVHGAQMANSIFSVEGTMFVELGCHIPKFLGSQTYLRLIGAEYLGVAACANGENSTGKVVCLDCAKKKKDHIYCNFTMSQESFDAMMEHVLSIVN